MNKNNADTVKRVAGLSFRQILLLATLFAIVRAGVIHSYNSAGYYYYYGMVSNQYAIAEAAFNGHFFSQDKTLKAVVGEEAVRTGRPIPLERWKFFPKSGVYTTFPAQDLPGFGYIIAYTSKWLGGELTAKPAHIIQLATEFAAMICLALCAGALLGGNAAFAFGLFYIFLFPFVWPLAFQPMRDIFNFAVFSFFIGAFFVFSRGRGWKSAGAAAALLCLSCLLLWTAPKGYYFMFMAAPAAFFLRHKAPAARAAFFAACVIVPLAIFGLPFRHFNIAHYGSPSTGVMGRGLWQGMGIVGENKYGFVLDDAALIPFLESRGHENIEYSSPEMNRLLGEYAVEVVKSDPAFYLRSVAVRTKQAARSPLPGFFIQKLNRFNSGMSRLEFMRASPVDAAKETLQDFWRLSVFYLGFIFSAFMLAASKETRAETAVFILPPLYLLATSIPVHFEERYMAPAAVSLILPLMWGARALWRAARGRSSRTAN